jgi:hypothetical protein
VERWRQRSHREDCQRRVCHRGRDGRCGRGRRGKPRGRRV